jgi:hypothetical protein
MTPFQSSDNRPIAGRTPTGLGTIILRFIGLFCLAVVILVLIWSR